LVTKISRHDILLVEPHRISKSVFFHQVMSGWFPMPLWKTLASKMGLRCNMNA